ncbi:MAG: 16S rRNA (guanine(966)-N(2))-methyltransferase RsmD [Alphaproteobacteria bacterium]|nr:16S rRNA (guanine(966)-N(2))-methyltransferase RsmD [Alphaproteobacteria bacterium]
MRIVSGRFGGRRLEVPKNRDIRPTSDKIRGAIFNSLASRRVLENAQILDIFCGTGALGLEALSRGAAFCTFIDKNRESLALTQRNISTLGAGDIASTQLKDFSKPVTKPDNTPQATLAFLDPPYGKNLLSPALHTLHEGAWLSFAGALCVIEMEKGACPALPAPYKVFDERVYGETKILLLHYESTL